MSDKHKKLLEGIAAILEVKVDSLTAATALDPWDSLCVMQAVVLIDDVCGKVVSGRQLMDCAKVEDVLKVAEVE
jgi:acyl carrier protein